MSAALALVENSYDPMAAVRTLNRMRTAGFILSLEGGRLMCKPQSRLSEQQRATLQANKAGLIELLADADTLITALEQAGHDGLGWGEGTPEDWPDSRLLAAGEVLYANGRMVNVRGRRYIAELMHTIDDSNTKHLEVAQ